MQFKLHAPYEPAGDQPQAIEQLADLYNRGTQASVLLGVTGSGKTFTMANLVEKLQRPTLVISHNKTLAAQLYAEFKGFFPENAVEYFVSYYDYYQPEAYLPVTDVYIEKDLSINDEIEKLRLSTSSALLSGRRDVLVVSSVSCLYGIGNPDDFHANTITLRTGEKEDFNKLLYRLVDALYSRNENEFKRGTFRVRGDVVDVYLAYDDIACRIAFWGNTIDSIERLDPLTGGVLERVEGIAIYPASAFVTTKERKEQAIRNIQDDLTDRVSALKEMGKHLEAKRLLDRVEFDIEMMRELGYCSGIENYSRYFDGRAPGTRPFCLLDYFPEDFLVIVDESHVTLPQVRAMYGGDRSRKQVLIEYGFRLPAAADNRPLTFDEFDSVIGQRLYVSATPADYELQRSEGLIVEQVVRPTGLLDPPIEVRGTEGQIDNLVEEIRICAAKDQRVLVTTLTKRMAEELHKFLQKIAVRCTYIHSDIETLERIRILEEFQKGYYDVLIGVNLLREGLDLPQVSLVAILDADKEGFLRSERALTQTAGRAARNVEGRVVMYADKITDSMARTIEETERRRSKQIRYNREHGITPTQIARNVRNTLDREYAQDGMEQMALTLAEDPVMQSMTPQQLEKAIATARHRMEEAAQKLDFITAAKFRDEMYILEKFKK
ncbi:MAG: excinuclease ABC subunit UvrB [Bacteroidales bacterium]|jgi:excinuclease ABC subunit B|nr:excinuclease ABC subunit UvrB [Bacteroidales bacterium]HPX79674.1 excinuclease ABC subunit UvrB [Bacteroidales bacterium]